MEVEVRIKQVLLAGLVLAVAPTVLATPQKKVVEPIKVYIFTAQNSGGFTDEDYSQRIHSVHDLTNTLGKKKVIRLVHTESEADVSLEVLGRGYEETGSETTYQNPLGGLTTSNDAIAAVRVGLKAGIYSTMIVGTAPPGTIRTWWFAAAVAANDIESWVKANHDRLIAQRH